MFEKYHLMRADFEDREIPLYTIQKGWAVAEGAKSRPETSINLQGQTWSTPSRPSNVEENLSLYRMHSFLYAVSGAAFSSRQVCLRYYLLLYTLNGSGRLEYEGRTYDVHPGDAFLIDRRKVHSFYATAPFWEHLEIHFDGASSDYLYRQITQEGHVVCMEDKSGFLREIEQLLDRSENVRIHRELMVSNQLERILLQLLVQSEAYQKRVQEIPENLTYLLRYMEQHYTEAMSLDDLSAFSNISKYHLCRVFKACTGYAPNDYIIQLRIENAKNLLLASDLSVAAVSRSVGIEDETYFHRLFRKKTGQSPGEFRKTKGLRAGETR